MVCSCCDSIGKVSCHLIICMGLQYCITSMASGYKTTSSRSITHAQKCSTFWQRKRMTSHVQHCSQLLCTSQSYSYSQPQQTSSCQIMYSLATRAPVTSSAAYNAGRQVAVHPCSALELVLAQLLQRHILQSLGICRLQDHRRRLAGLQRLAPPCCAQAPPAAFHQPVIAQTAAVASIVGKHVVVIRHDAFDTKCGLQGRETSKVKIAARIPTATYALQPM